MEKEKRAWGGRNPGAAEGTRERRFGVTAACTASRTRHKKRVTTKVCRPSWLWAPLALLWMGNPPNCWDRNGQSHAQMLQLRGSAFYLEQGHRGAQQKTVPPQLGFC